MIKFDVAIIGSGLAGLTVALNLAEKKKVVIISKGEIKDGATRWAQGGIAAALDFEDSLDKHITDTIKAGAGLCDLEVTQKILSKRFVFPWPLFPITTVRPDGKEISRD